VKQKLFKSYDSRCPSGKLPRCSSFSNIYQRHFLAPFEGTSSTLRRRRDPHLIIYSESNYDKLQRHMREDLLKIHDWFYNNLLSFNVSKTEYIIFNPKNKNIPQPNRLLVRGADLGLMIDEIMDWSDHVSYIKKKIFPKLQKKLYKKNLHLTKLYDSKVFCCFFFFGTLILKVLNDKSLFVW
jgi:hypothetical protein